MGCVWGCWATFTGVGKNKYCSNADSSNWIETGPATAAPIAPPPIPEVMQVGMAVVPKGSSSSLLSSDSIFNGEVMLTYLRTAKAIIVSLSLV